MPEYKKPKEVEPAHQFDLERIGKKLMELRVMKGIPVSNFAKELGISRNSYSQMEKGQIYFYSYNFFKLLKYHKIPLEDFFSDL